ncbi:MAG: electron transport complex subunit RsxE [Oscillospiraceae bacterium]|nr:electron transport complex subunit RsxE [Oscillospiraceae bacterium]
MKDNKLCAAIAANPALVLVLGACPALGATTGVLPALTLGVSALVIMLLAALCSSLLKNVISDALKPFVHLVLAAGFAAIVQLLVHAWFPAQFNALGVYTTLLAADLLIFAISERAGERSVGAALSDSLLTGLGFVVALVITAAVRELFGVGSFAGIVVPFFKAHTVNVLASAAGGFFVFAFVMALFRVVFKREDAIVDTANVCVKEEA